MAKIDIVCKLLHVATINDLLFFPQFSTVRRVPCFFSKRSKFQMEPLIWTLDYYCYYDPYHPENNFDQLIPCLTVKGLVCWSLGWKVWKIICPGVLVRLQL